MTFAIANLQPVGGNARVGKAPMVWAYATLDGATDVDGSGYFNSAAKLLHIGDIIWRVTWSTAIGTGGTISAYGTHIVLSNSAGVVDVSNETDLTETDSD